MLIHSGPAGCQVRGQHLGGDTTLQFMTLNLCFCSSTDCSQLWPLLVSLGFGL